MTTPEIDALELLGMIRGSPRCHSATMAIEDWAVRCILPEGHGISIRGQFAHEGILRSKTADLNLDWFTGDRGEFMTDEEALFGWNVKTPAARPDTLPPTPARW